MAEFRGVAERGLLERFVPGLPLHAEDLGPPSREARALVAAQRELEAALGEAGPNARRVAAARRRLARADREWVEATGGRW